MPRQKAEQRGAWTVVSEAIQIFPLSMASGTWTTDWVTVPRQEAKGTEDDGMPLGTNASSNDICRPNYALKGRKNWNLANYERLRRAKV